MFTYSEGSAKVVYADKQDGFTRRQNKKMHSNTVGNATLDNRPTTLHCQHHDGNKQSEHVILIATSYSSLNPLFVSALIVW